MTEFVGQGDARRSMALLWGRVEAPTRGPKQALSPDVIAAAAIEVADELGLGALSMRKVGERLGTSAMALYTYVPAKTELLDLMVDRVLRELAEAMPTEGDWRSQVEAWAEAHWAWARRHPWMQQISTARPLLGPGELDVYEKQLRIFAGLGLSAVEMSKVTTTVATFIGGAVKTVADTWAAEAAMETPEDAWWYERSGLLEEMTADLEWSEVYPTVTALQQQGAFDQAERDPDDASPYLEREALDAFTFGLARLLDGIEAYVAARRPA